MLPLAKFPQSDIEYYLRKLSSAERYRLDREEIRELLSKLAANNLDEILNSYLGHFWSADFSEIWRAPPQSSAGEWHHDNVGNRVKIFIILVNDSPENGTEIIPFTHKSRWKSFVGRSPQPKGTPFFIEQRPGNVVIFDTNSIHRGMYSPKERIVMQVEFTNILKSFLVPGQVGRFFRGRYDNSYKKLR